MIEHPQLIFAGIMLAVAALIASLFAKLPDWSRLGLFFAVSVAPSCRTSDDARKILQSYRLYVVAQIAIAFALIIAGAFYQRFVILIVGIFWLIAGPLAAVSSAHKEALPHAVAVPRIHDVPFVPRPRQLPGGWVIQLGPFAILLITAAYLRVRWNEIPNRFPVHWGADGAPNRWSLRTPADVYGPVLFGAMMVAIISLLAFAISSAAGRVLPTANAPGKIQHAHRIAVVMVGIEFFVAAMFAIVGLLPFSASPGVAPMVIVALAILATAFFFHHGFRRHAHTAIGQLPGDGTPDSCWKLGLFYFNPADSTLFVEKRIGIGYTLNFARTAAWVLMGVTLVISVGVATLFSWKH